MRIAPVSLIHCAGPRDFTKPLTWPTFSTRSRLMPVFTIRFDQSMPRDGLGAWQRTAISCSPRRCGSGLLMNRIRVRPIPVQKMKKMVRAGFDVLRNAGKLGAMLLRFPFSFHLTRETMIYLQTVLARCADYPLAVEVRHATWNVPEVFAMLRERGVGFCNIDQPVIGQSLHPSAEATVAVGYVRLHGRRYDSWFSDDETIPSDERYNYLYSEEELRPWADRVGKVAETARNIYVITNNHYQGKGVVNALQLISMLKGSKVKVPEPPRAKYPELERIASEAPQEPTLF